MQVCPEIDQEHKNVLFVLLSQDHYQLQRHTHVRTHEIFSFRFGSATLDAFSQEIRLISLLVPRASYAFYV